MKKRIPLVVCTASLFVVFPVLAQNSGSQGEHGNNGHGNGSDHSGHDENGSDKSGHDENGSDKSGHDDNGSGDDKNKDKGDQGNKGHGDDNLVLATSEVRAAVANAAASVTDALSSGSLRTSAGALIPTSAQAHAYSVLIADPTLSASSAEISAALSTAGPEANAIVPSLLRRFSALGSHPAKLPSAIAEFNRFTRAASSAFLSNPPQEFIAVHTVLARLAAATTSAK
jgi:hypothetical protein